MAFVNVWCPHCGEALTAFAAVSSVDRETQTSKPKHLTVRFSTVLVDHTCKAPV